MKEGAAMNKKKLLVVQAAGLGHDILGRQLNPAASSGLRFRAMDSVFPAVTCTVQASFRTASTPAEHGVVANGYMDRSLMKTFFWEQSASLVHGPRIWDEFRQKGGTVGMLFWQQSLGESADVIISPAPVHLHHGGMIQSCYSKPPTVYDRIAEVLHAPFDLKYYWGPMASPTSSVWIADATCALLEDKASAPDLCLTYLPALDYDMQRYGPDDQRCIRPFCSLLHQLERLCQVGEQEGYQILIFGDYAIASCSKGPVFPNIALVEAGMLGTREIRGMKYPDIANSRAFAVVDHEIAHVYVRRHSDIEAVKKVMEGLPGVESVLDGKRQTEMGIAHPRSGDLVLVAADGYWFAYNFWRVSEYPPDYACHVDIHQKPGFDPCELFSDWLPWRSSTNTRRIMGSHGKLGPARTIAWVSTFIENEPRNIIELAGEVRAWLGRE